MKKSNSQLNAVETSDVYKLINKVCWHLANDVSDAPKETSAKKQKFAELRCTQGNFSKKTKIC